MSEHYLTSLARDGAIYSEFFTSPDHAIKAGLSPQAYTDALGEGISRAKAKTGIEGRMIVTGVRHVGVEAIEQAARFAARCGHPLVTGFGVAGDERMGDFEDYVRAFEIAREAGLGVTIHAGELMGWESVQAALDYIKPSRIGHGVRAIENPDLVKRIADEGVVLECCPGSNVALGVFPSFAEHPFPASQESRLQGDAELRRSTLFLDVAEARIRHRLRAFRHERQGAARHHQDGHRGGLRGPEDQGSAAGEAQVSPGTLPKTVVGHGLAVP